jgi:hypothetical protein
MIVAVECNLPFPCSGSTTVVPSSGPALSGSSKSLLEFLLPGDTVSHSFEDSASREIFHDSHRPRQPSQPDRKLNSSSSRQKNDQDLNSLAVLARRERLTPRILTMIAAHPVSRSHSCVRWQAREALRNGGGGGVGGDDEKPDDQAE